MAGIVPQGAGVVSALASAVDCTGIVIVPPAGMDGPEKGVIPLKPAEAPRVSTKRQGVTATKVRAFGEIAFGENNRFDPVIGDTTSCGAACAAASLSGWLGCQYSGVAQFFNGTTFPCRATCAVMAADASTKREITRIK